MHWHIEVHIPPDHHTLSASSCKLGAPETRWTQTGSRVHKRAERRAKIWCSL